MTGYSTRMLDTQVGGDAWHLRVLADTCQFDDPDGHGDALGISSAQWSLFGQLWPSGQLLAQAVHDVDIAGKRILELGCGIGLASLVLHRRGAAVTASDIHPLTEPFLAYNAALNGLDAVDYRQLRWDLPLPTLGRFDMVIASDVLYEPAQVQLLAAVVERHAEPRAEVMVTDPGRGNSTRFSKALAAQGFSVVQTRCPRDDNDPPPYRGRLLHYRRGFDTP